MSRGNASRRQGKKAASRRAGHLMGQLEAVRSALDNDPADTDGWREQLLAAGAVLGGCITEEAGRMWRRGTSRSTVLGQMAARQATYDEPLSPYALHRVAGLASLTGQEELAQMIYPADSYGSPVTPE